MIHSGHMKEFLKPNKKKMLLFVPLLFIEFVVLSMIASFTVSSPAPMCLPELGNTPPDVYQNPHSLSEAWKLANTPDPCGYAWTGIYSPLVMTIKYIPVTLSLLVTYIVSCIVVTMKDKLKKKNKTYTATSKK